MYTTKKSLLKRMQKCDDISWEEFYRIYWPLVNAVGQKLGLSPDLTRDLMQEIMLDLFQKESLLRYDASKGKFRTFFGVLIRHKASEMLHDSARFAAFSNAGRSESGNDSALPAMLEPHEKENGNDPFQKIFDEEYRKCLLELALNELRKHVEPETYDIFEMVALQSRPPKDVAKYLGISRAVIDVYCSRCRKKLQKIVSEIRKDTPDFNPELPQ